MGACVYMEKLTKKIEIREKVFGIKEIYLLFDSKINTAYINKDCIKRPEKNYVIDLRLDLLPEIF
jgi:hypothetical protein